MMSQKINRLPGIDILKILSMYLIVLLHVVQHGGGLRAPQPRSSQYWIMWLVEIISYCAVNCYALISGYTMSSVKLKLDRLLQIWLQVLFYSIGLGIIVGCFRPELISVRTIISMLLPIISGEYWYISCYFILFFFSPIINVATANLEKNVLIKILIGLAVLQCVVPEKIFINTYGMNSGFSALWLIQMYLVGNMLKRYGVPLILLRLGKALFILALLVTIGWKYFFENLIAIPQAANLFVSYMSLTIILMSLSMFAVLYNSKIEENVAKYLQRISVATLGVYLFHEHPMMVWVSKLEPYINPLLNVLQ